MWKCILAAVAFMTFANLCVACRYRDESVVFVQLRWNLDLLTLTVRRLQRTCNLEYSRIRIL